jgi:succinate dehydrogenase/fumarate reductase flavoprotein subunit
MSAVVDFDCIVIGSGHAGCCAALSAAQNGCQKVLIIDKCPAEWFGGNGYFTAGAHRTVHSGLTSEEAPESSLLPLLHKQLENLDKIDIAPYTEPDFTNDIQRLSSGRSDPSIVAAVVNNSRRTLGWLADYVGVPFVLSFHRQAYEVEGRLKFWGGMALSVEDGGKGLMEAHKIALEREGIEVWFDTKATGLLLDSLDRVTGVVVSRNDSATQATLNCRAVILAAGGFEANADMRSKILGTEWQNARVRGTPYNTGEMFTVAQSIGAKVTPDWASAGCHSTAWDSDASADAGDRVLTNQYTKSGYPLGLMLNVLGKRFVDEGEDMRNYTYAKFGRRILEQKKGEAFQIFDAKVSNWLRKEEYGNDVVRKVTADTLEELAAKLLDHGLEDSPAFLQTIYEYNASVLQHESGRPWDPAVKDGLSTGTDITPPKSNWALTIENPPFMAIKVACGITFTFGGLAIHPETAGVVSERTGQTIDGLFCAGEMVGGLFYGNYPGGSGLTAGAVFGQKAGKHAASAVGSVY